MKYFLAVWWLIIGVLMIYMNDFKLDSLGWLFVVASPAWLLKQ